MSIDHLEYTDNPDQASQFVADAVTGNINAYPNDFGSDESSEVRQMEWSQYTVKQVAEQLFIAMDAANKLPIQRVTQTAGEVITRSVFCPANVTTRLCAMNFNRSRVIISGINVNCFVGNDKSLQLVTVGAGSLFGDATPVGYAVAVNVPWTREFRTIRDLYAICLTDAVIGVHEEFMAGDN